MNSIKVSWDAFYKSQRELVKKIKDSGRKYKYIVAIPSGGLIPAYCLSKALKIPVVTINIKSYVEQGKRGDIVHYKVDGFDDFIKNQEDALVVDDMFDSGETMKYIQKIISPLSLFHQQSINVFEIQYL